jgi:hypothetical protein
MVIRDCSLDDRSAPQLFRAGRSRTGGEGLLWPLMKGLDEVLTLAAPVGNEDASSAGSECPTLCGSSSMCYRA